jgi:hypothetical protein
MEAEDRVLLVDLENIVGSVRPKPDLVRARVGLLIDAAGPVHHVVAAWAQGDPAGDPLVSVLAELRVTTWLVPGGEPDAADAVLLAHARHVYAHGGRSFVIASGDGKFAEIAKLGAVRLEVLAWEKQSIARPLEKAAGKVHRLNPRPAVATIEPPKDHRPEAAAAPMSPSVRPERAQPASLAIGPWAALLAGLGIGVGQKFAAAVLDRQR